MRQLVRGAITSSGWTMASAVSEVPGPVPVEAFGLGPVACVTRNRGAASFAVRPGAWYRCPGPTSRSDKASVGHPVRAAAPLSSVGDGPVPP